MKHFYTISFGKLSNIFKCALIATVALTPKTINAQFISTTSQTANQLAQTLVGTGVTYNNANLNCQPAANAKFTNANTSLVGIDSGIVLTSGGASNIGSPASNFLSTGYVSAGDAQLAAIAGTSTWDACILEFDFVPAGDTVKFDYVFASEEHPGFWCQSVNDVFGFFINGPGITGTQNLAVVPGTNIPVTIN